MDDQRTQHIMDDQPKVFSNIAISGNAKVHLGDTYISSAPDVKEPIDILRESLWFNEIW